MKAFRGTLVLKKTLNPNRKSKMANLDVISSLWEPITDTGLFYAVLTRLEFKLDNSNLIHTKSGYCVQPVSSAADGVALGLYSSCGGHQFSFTAGGSLQHVGSKLCVNTKSGVSARALLKE